MCVTIMHNSLNQNNTLLFRKIGYFIEKLSSANEIYDIF